MKKLFFFDTETTGVSSDDCIIQFGAIFGSYNPETHTFYEERVINQFINTDREISEAAASIHGISKEHISQFGHMKDYIKEFFAYMTKADFIIGHNLDFDMRMLFGDMHRCGIESIDLTKAQHVCTMRSSTDICCIPGGKMGYKRPKLHELHMHLFNEGFDDAHDAMADIRATQRCFLELIKKGHIALS